ncbi:MAG: TetR/AcrR family transcriptional regulator, partial [Tateyamaria sp.]|nr:TetR/AcrR family transcriptional regulator [Tateyamaria sp.]
MDQNPVPTRGRPKLLDREQILQTALIEYWAKGPTNVSISEICKQTGTSKPSVYREFSSDDGLKSSVFESYR